MGVRYPPYTPGQLKKYLRTNKIGTPNFDRNGNPIKRGFLVSLLSLGAASKKAAVLRYLVAIVGMLAFFSSSGF